MLLVFKLGNTAEGYTIFWTWKVVIADVRISWGDVETLCLISGEHILDILLMIPCSGTHWKYLVYILIWLTEAAFTYQLSFKVLMTYFTDGLL